MATTPSRSPSLAPRAKRLRRDPVTRVTHGCCVTGMRAMRDGGARLVLADPPYRGDTAEWDSDGAYMEFAAAWMREAARVLQPGGALLFYGSPCTLFTSRMNVLLADELHMHHVQTLTWVYTQGGDSRLETMKSYSVRSELIEWWVKPAGVRTFHPELATERYSEEDKRAALAKGVGRVSEASIDKGRPPRTWVDIPRENSRSKERQYGKHPSMKPMTLCERLINVHSDPHDLVVVPFAGSGSEVLVGARLARNVVGFETNPEYIGLMRRRFEGHGLSVEFA